MGLADISSAKHHLCYEAYRSKDHLCFKGIILITGSKTIDIKLEKKSFYASYIHSVFHEVAWMTLSDKTFTNCVCNCRAFTEAAASAIADDYNPFAGLEEDEDAVKTLATDLNFLRTNYNDLAIDEYIDFDRELSTNHNILRGKDIIDEVLVNSDDKKLSAVESIRKPLIEVRRAIEMLEEFSL